jgi:hypothetical protein
MAAAGEALETGVALTFAHASRRAATGLATGKWHAWFRIRINATA